MSRRVHLTVLDTLDVAKTQVYHFKAIIISGMGFFTDSYDLFSISIVTKLFGRLYYTKPGHDQMPGKLPLKVAYFVYGVALCGTFAGQLFFGCLGDKLGRKEVYGVTLILMVVCSLASGLSFGETREGIITTLCFFRFWLGFGIGGDYPLTATIMSEYANKKTRGAFIAAFFAMQGFGILAGGIVSLVVSAIFNSIWKVNRSYHVNAVASQLPPKSDYIWRIILMFGAIPAAMTYYWRMQMPETARYTALVAQNARQAALDMSRVLQVEVEVEQEVVEKVTQQQYGLFSTKFLRRHGRHLFGCSICWLLLDIGYYSQTLFQKDVFVSIGWLPPANTTSGPEEVYKVATAQTLIALCGVIPGFLFTVVTIDYIGRFVIQLMGFFFMSVFMFALAIPYNHWKKSSNKSSFLLMYSFTFFFANFGPNSTTFIVPAEIFPARLRSTCHGIAAASGKVGAMIGTFGFLSLTEGDDSGTTSDKYIKRALVILSVINAFGVAFTFIVPETKGKSLEEWELGEENGTGDRYASTIELSERPLFARA